jgi:hypothetical protein
MYLQLDHGGGGGDGGKECSTDRRLMCLELDQNDADGDGDDYGNGNGATNDGGKATTENIYQLPMRCYSLFSALYKDVLILILTAQEVSSNIPLFIDGEAEAWEAK